MLKGRIMNRYKAAKGARYNNKDAQVIGTHLESLGGEFTPEQVLEEAGSKKSPIHRFFQWNNTKAARQFRLQQARHLVNHLLIVITIDNEEVGTKAFHSIEVELGDATEKEYSSFEVVINDPDRKNQIIERALAEVEAWTERWTQYSSVFGGVFKAVDKARSGRTTNAP